MNLIYATGRPYGAPLAILRGGATRDDEIQRRMHGEGFRYDQQLHGYRLYLHDDEFAEAINRIVKDRPDITVKPKSTQEPLEGVNGQ